MFFYSFSSTFPMSFTSSTLPIVQTVQLCENIFILCSSVQEHCLMYLHCIPAWHIALHRNKTRQRLHRNEICRCMADLDQESYRDTTSGTEIQKNASKKGKYFSAPVPRASWPPSNASHIKNLCISDVNRSVTHRCLACILPGHTKLRFEKKASKDFLQRIFC